MIINNTEAASKEKEPLEDDFSLWLSAYAASGVDGERKDVHRRLAVAKQTAVNQLNSR